MHYIRKISILVIISLIAAVGVNADTAFQTVNNDALKAAINSVDENNAFIIFADTIKKNKMDFIDDTEAAPASETYSEKVVLDGIEGRKVYRENYLYMKFDDSFISREENEVMVSITYYDFGPDPGSYHLEYISNDNKLDEQGRIYKRITLRKSGLAKKWYTDKVYLDDAAFDHSQNNDCDMRIVTNAYNAFAKIEVVNVSRSKKNPDIKMGSVNIAKAEVLNKLGLYKGISDQVFTPALEQNISREQTIVEMITALGLNGEISEKEKCNFTDVSDFAKPYVALAAKLGIIAGCGDTFEAKRNITKRELLTIYLRALGFEDDNLYENAEQIAAENGLIQGDDLIFLIDRDAIRDNFVAVSYNAIILENKITNKTIMEDFLKNKIYTTEQVKATGDANMIRQTYKEPRKIAKKEFIDEKTGRIINYVNFEGNIAVRPYITQTHWDNNGKRFIVGETKTQTFYSYNIETEEAVMLDEAHVGGSLEAMITPDNDIYYIRPKDRGINKINLDTLKIEKIADRPSYVTGLSGIMVTNDGTKLTGYWIEDRSPLDRVNGALRNRILPILDTKTGVWDTSLSHEFDGPNPHYSYGHPLINPVYKNLLFFCHEGTTQEINDRLWIMDIDTGERKNLFVQAERPDGITGETSGHEIWTMDGEEMFFVKYNMPQNIGQSGIVRIDKTGEKREYINGDYMYWHCHPSPDKNWVVADTQISGGQTEIILVNTNTYETYYICNYRMRIGSHPNQPHPMFSQDGQKVSFQMDDENGVLGVGWVDVSDIVSKTPVGGITKISDSAEFTSYNDVKNYVEKSKYADKDDCFRVPAKNNMYVNINDNLLYDSNTPVKLSITYLDLGWQPIKLTYTAGITRSEDLAKRENKIYNIERGNTKKWKTIEVCLESANFKNSCEYRADFKIGGYYSDLYIKNIELIK